MDHLQDACCNSKSPLDSKTLKGSLESKSIEHHTSSTDEENCLKILGEEKCMTDLDCKNSATLFLDDLNEVPSQDQKNCTTDYFQKYPDSSCDQLAVFRNDIPILDENLNEASHMPTLLTNVGDSLDVSQSSDANQEYISNTPLDKNLNQSVEYQMTENIMENNTVVNDGSLQVGKHGTFVGNEETRKKQDTEHQAPITTEVPQQCEVLDVLSEECIRCTEGKSECSLKDERQVEKTEFVVQSLDCNNTSDNTNKEISNIPIDAVSVSDHSVDNGLIDLEQYQHVFEKNLHGNEACKKTGSHLADCNQVVEQGSFEFLQSCFGISDLDHHVNQLETDSQICNDQPPVLMDVLPKCTDKIQMKESEQDVCIYHKTPTPPHHRSHNDTLEGKILPTRTGDRHTSKIASSNKLIKKLQPIVLLQTTERTNDGNKYHCSVCQNSTDSLDELIEHQNYKHNPHEVQYCLACERYFLKGISAAQHVCNQTGPKDLQLLYLEQMAKKLKKSAEKYKCRYCCKSFIKKAYHHDHEQRHVFMTQHRCDVCGLYFSASHRLSSHKRKSKCNPMVLDPNGELKKSPKKGIKKMYQPKCPTSLQNCFVKLVDINKQDLSPQKIYGPYSNKSFNLRVEMKDHLKSHKDVKPLKCGKCNKLFKYFWKLNKHRRSCARKNKQINRGPASLPGKYPCPICPRVFLYTYNVTRHLRKQCLNEYSQQGKGRVGNRYKCPLCSATFSEGGNRLRHVRNTCLRRYKARQLLSRTKVILDCVEENKDKLITSLSSQECSDLGSLKCKFCEKSFSSNSLLKNHLKRHRGNKPFQCLTCGKTFTKQNHLVVHKNVHSRRIQCSVCKKILPSIEILLKHRQSHITKGLLHCPDCPMQFKFPVYFLRHIATHTKKSMSKSKDLGNNTSVYKRTLSNYHIERGTQKIYEPFCKICQKAFVDSKTLSEHCVTHWPKASDFKCPFCKRLYSCRISVIRHIRIHTGEKPFQCQKCGLHMRRKEALQLHLTKCEGPQETSLINTDMLEKRKRFKCSYCPHVFRGSGNLKMHEKAHRLNSLVPCSMCGRYYKKKKISEHRKICHVKDFCHENAKMKMLSEKINNAVVDNQLSTDVKALSVSIRDGFKEQCPHCFKCFQFKCYLLRHLRTHLNKKLSKPLNEPDEKNKTMSQNLDDLKCNFCTKTFTKLQNLRRHILTHAEVKPYHCKMCKSSFSQYDVLKIHQAHCNGKRQRLKVRIEKNTLDDIFTSATNCKISTVESSEQIPSKSNASVQSCRETPKHIQQLGHCSNKYKYQCDYCPRMFKMQIHLNFHTRLHTGEKPFECTSCRERFIRKDYLQRHLNRGCQTGKCPKVLCDRCGVLFTQDALVVHQSNCVIIQGAPGSSQIITSTSSSSKIKAFSCVICRDHFLLFSQLQQHVLTKHRAKERQQSNNIENQQVTSTLSIKEKAEDEGGDGSNSNWHQMPNPNELENSNSESKRHFECVQCHVNCMTKSGLVIHMRTHALSYPLFCKKCKKGFWKKHLLQRHTRSCKGLDAIGKDLNENVILFNKGTNTTGTGVLQTKFSCKGQNKEETDKDNAVHKYQCSECDKSFTDGLRLISHLEAHGREDQQQKACKKYSCQHCHQTYDQAGLLQRHMKVKHQQIITHTCPECSKIFRSPSELVVHKTLHDPHRPFACETCEFRFWTAKSLKLHQRHVHASSDSLKTVESSQTYGGMTPEVYTCSPCNKTYTIKKSYLKHCRIKHKICPESASDGKSASMEQNSDKNESDGDDAGDEVVSDNDSDSAPYFPCHVCGKTFSTSASLEDHQKCHLGEKPFECEECGKCFCQLINLQQHQRSHKSEFQCPLCGRGFVTLWALRKHKHSHVRKHPYQCTKCNLGFPKSYQLAEHMNTHREENFPCDLCNETFSCKSSRAEHRKTHTQMEEELPPLIPSTQRTSPSPLSITTSLRHARHHCETCHVQFTDPEQLSEHGCDTAKERPYSCVECNKHFLHGSHLKKHQLTHQLSGTCSFQCNTCHLSFNHRSHFLTHLQTHGCKSSPEYQMGNKVKLLNTSDLNQDKIYKCPICPESFSQALELANHLSVHSHICNVCTKTFPTKQQLQEHEQTHLTAATQYECTECGKKFLGSNAFRRHHCSNQKCMFSEKSSSLPPPHKKRALESSIVISNDEEEEVDVGEDFYNCQTCNKRFSSTYSLQEHQKLHEENRPFKCLICGKGFAQRRYLKQHQQTHNERPYQCDSCSESFKTESSLLSHQKMHDATCKHHCSMCNKSYSSPSKLARHQQTHPERQDVGQESSDHRCEMCYKSFTHLSQLCKHQETHVGQIVYECTECDKAFAFLNLLEQHQKTHTRSVDSAQFQSHSNSFFESPTE